MREVGLSAHLSSIIGSWLASPLDADPNEAAVLGPAAVVVPNILEAEEFLENEPRVRRTLSDAAVGNDFLVRSDALCGIEILELVGILEGAVLVHGLAPRDVA